MVFQVLDYHNTKVYITSEISFYTLNKCFLFLVDPSQEFNAAEHDLENIATTINATNTYIGTIANNYRATKNLGHKKCKNAQI